MVKPASLFILLTVVSILGCTEPSTVEDSTIKGTLVGKVLLLREPGGDSVSFAGTTVEAEGTPFRTLTDRNGEFQLSLPTGTYVIRFYRRGFGEYKEVNVQFAAPGRARLYGGSRSVFLAPIPTIEATNIHFDTTQPWSDPSIRFSFSNLGGNLWDYFPSLALTPICILSSYDPRKLSEGNTIEIFPWRTDSIGFLISLSKDALEKLGSTDTLYLTILPWYPGNNYFGSYRDVKGTFYRTALGTKKVVFPFVLPR